MASSGLRSGSAGDGDELDDEAPALPLTTPTPSTARSARRRHELIDFIADD